ncbi:unnamed protein product [Paramecium primaurelia]|uniref:Uncharacterized protein n=1 Tax=Paramecium primaurelia TaxID=5886 RepID=A0A8S1NIR8_PARPR|nr:unnamed protein product [Paramecium primaurelia]
MLNQRMLFEAETEEIPNEITEEMKQIIKVIDSFDIEELRKLVNDEVGICSDIC